MAARKKAKRKKSDPASRPGAFQLRKGGPIQNSKDPKDKVAAEIRKRTARAKARRNKK
jgi:hypothetical protein